MGIQAADLTTAPERRKFLWILLSSSWICWAMVGDLSIAATDCTVQVTRQHGLRDTELRLSGDTAVTFVDEMNTLLAKLPKATKPIITPAGSPYIQVLSWGESRITRMPLGLRR